MCKEQSADYSLLITDSLTTAAIGNIIKGIGVTERSWDIFQVDRLLDSATAIAGWQ
jgi:hypothetical protein